MNYQTIKLAAGAHDPSENKGCLMEVVACLHGEQWSDAPPCTCPALAAFGRRLNDWMADDERQLLWPFTLRLGGTGDGRTQERAFRFADWAVREIAPLALDAEGRTEDAARLRALKPVEDRESADAAAYAARAATYATYAADAATDAAAAAAAYAANAAAAYAANAAAALPRATTIDKALALLDELCPPAPSPDEAALLNWQSLDRLVAKP